MIDYVLIAAAVLLLGSIFASRISDRFGIPALLLFLALGMLAGSDGPGGLYFDDPALAQAVGVVALAFILFSGGLDTEWKSIRPVARDAVLLATLGVVVTAIVMGGLAKLVLGLSWPTALLLGSIVSSTDAAAVFSILRSKSVSLKGQLKPLLEFESGSNDPMAVFLTVGMIQIISQPSASISSLVGRFFVQMIVGGLAGFVFGRVVVIVINRIRLGYDGLYPVLTLAWVALAYGLTSVIGGNGFLAVYIMGIAVGNREFIHRRSILRFHDGLAWLMQIAMFLTLGLLVFPSQLLPVAGMGLLLAFGLMFVARPVGVFLCLARSSWSVREKLFISWVGLRGAVPIILATFPLLAGVPSSGLIFNIVFFVVLTSALLQGVSLPLVAHWLGVDMPAPPRRALPLEYNPAVAGTTELTEIVLADGCRAAHKAIVDLGLPSQFLIVLVGRQGEYIIPSGAFVLEPGDTILAIADRESLEDAKMSFCARPS